jgi:hypothetical protein
MISTLGNNQYRLMKQSKPPLIDTDVLFNEDNYEIEEEFDDKCEQ